MLLVQLNLDRLLARMWEEMGLVRVYTKPQGQQPDFTEPVVLSVVCYISFWYQMNENISVIFMLEVPGYSFSQFFILFSGY